MTNLEMLLKNDPMILDFVADRVSEKYCISTETMKAEECMHCYKCPFFLKEDCNYECDDREKAWLLEEYSEVSELASIDKGTGTIVGGGPDE